jgi:hypothetical protein
MATSPIPIVSGKSTPLEPGLWKLNIIIAVAGPTTVAVSSNEGVSFQTETDGVFTASGTALIEIGRGDLFRGTFQGGDAMTASLVRGWGKGS